MKNKVFSLVGILAITLVFGLTVVGCAMFQAMAASNEARQTDGKGGDITINNTSDSIDYFVIHPGSDGTFNSVLSSKRLTKNSRTFFSVDNDGTYFIYYRQVRGGENAPLLRDEDYRNWNSKSFTVSNDERINVNIPY